MRKWFYVLKLEGGHYYVGISNNFVRRHRQHVGGNGAAWTNLHAPVEVLFQHQHEVSDDRAAEEIENEITVRMMVEHGWQRVRGGFFCGLTERAVEEALRAHGYWSRVLQSTIDQPQAPADWTQGLKAVHTLAAAYLEGSSPVESRGALLAQLMSLRAHRYWHADLEPALEEKFWGAKGVLRVILSIKLNRVIGFKLQDPFAVLHSGMQMGRPGQQPWAHLFLAAWVAYRPTATDSQHARVDGYLAGQGSRVPDRQFDPIVSMLFPETRWRLRASTQAPHRRSSSARP